MSTNYHTPIATSAAGEAATVNAPLEELSDAINLILGGSGQRYTPIAIGALANVATVNAPLEELSDAINSQAGTSGLNFTELEVGTAVLNTNIALAEIDAAIPLWWLPTGITAGQCVAAYQPKGAADLADSYLNLNDLGTNDAYAGIAPAWAAGTGWTFNGTTQYLKTGITAVNDQSYTIIIRTANITTHGALILEKAEFQSSYIGIETGGLAVIYYNDGSYSATPAPASDTVLAVAGDVGYRDGVSDTPAITAAGLGAFVELYIGARNNEDKTVDTFFGGDVLAVAIYDTALTAAQVLELSERMERL